MKLMHAVKVSRTDYGERWPLTVDEGWLRRCPKSGALRFQVGRKVYALNGTARTVYGDADIEPIHAANPNIPPVPEDDGTVFPVRKPLTPLLRDAEAIRR